MSDPLVEQSNLLAETWSRNESGTLWEKLWLLRGGEWMSQLVCSGVFVGPVRYPDEARFWKAFEGERAVYGGRRLDSTGEQRPDAR